MKINGTVFRTYFICKRQSWLFKRELNPDQEFNFLLLGKMIHENSYTRNKKEIVIDNCKFDLIGKKDNKTLIGEIKKSSKALDSSILQLKYYLYILRKKGIKINGEILIPREKKRISVELNDEDICEIEKILQDIKKLIEGKIPEAERNKYCGKCAYFEFCWS